MKKKNLNNFNKKFNNNVILPLGIDNIKENRNTIIEGFKNIKPFINFKNGVVLLVLALTVIGSINAGEKYKKECYKLNGKWSNNLGVCKIDGLKLGFDELQSFIK